MIDIALRDGNALEKERVTPESSAPSSITELPQFSLTDLGGKTIEAKSLLGTVSAVEFWAEWCPPCRSTLSWLAEAQEKYGDKVRILGIAVESEEANIRAMVDSLKLPYPNAMGSSDIAMKFGGIVSVPTLFVFDRKGRTVRVFYGAPPDLHEQVERAIASARASAASGAAQDAHVTAEAIRVRLSPLPETPWLECTPIHGRRSALLCRPFECFRPQVISLTGAR